MLIACWSPKGGSGTTVVAAGLALVMAGGNGTPGAVLADLAGDVPAVLGLPEPPGAGLGDWLSAGPEVPDGALSQLEATPAPGLSLLPAGGALFGDAGGPERPDRAGDAGRGEALAALLAADVRPVIADCGSAVTPPLRDVAAGATLSLAVVRPCYLALRRALAAPLRPTGLVVVAERDRSLTPDDVEEVLGVPVVACVPQEPAIARAVDAGLLSARLPRPLERSLRPLVTDLLGRRAA